MLAFFSKLCTLFQTKIAKTAVFALCCEISIAKLIGCALTWYENGVPQLWNCVALQLNQKAHCRSCASEIKQIKLRILRCAFTG